MRHISRYFNTQNFFSPHNKINKKETPQPDNSHSLEIRDFPGPMVSHFSAAIKDSQGNIVKYLSIYPKPKNNNGETSLESETAKEPFLLGYARLEKPDEIQKHAHACYTIALKANQAKECASIIDSFTDSINDGTLRYSLLGEAVGMTNCASAVQSVLSVLEKPTRLQSEVFCTTPKGVRQRASALADRNNGSKKFISPINASDAQLPRLNLYSVNSIIASNLWCSYKIIKNDAMHQASKMFPARP